MGVGVNVCMCVCTCICECECGKAGTSHVCDGSAHSFGCVVNGSNTTAAF